MTWRWVSRESGWVGRYLMDVRSGEKEKPAEGASASSCNVLTGSESGLWMRQPTDYYSRASDVGGRDGSRNLACGLVRGVFIYPYCGLVLIL